MERLGADGVIAEGCESGGHVGETTTMVLVPQVADAVNIDMVGPGIPGGQPDPDPLGFQQGERDHAVFQQRAEGSRSGHHLADDVLGARANGVKKCAAPLASMAYRYAMVGFSISLLLITRATLSI